LSQLHEPEFWTSHCLSSVLPGTTMELSGMVISSKNVSPLKQDGVGVTKTRTGAKNVTVGIAVWVGKSGVGVGVGVDGIIVGVPGFGPQADKIMHKKKQMGTKDRLARFIMPIC
jgi:hypothetical protein